MLHTASPLKQTSLGSTLGSKSMLRVRGAHARRSTIAALMLTSLVDAFSILVIFLIVSHSANNEVVNIGDNVKLPVATESQLIQNGVVVRVENGRFLVEDKEVKLDNLLPYLKTLNSSVEAAKREGLVIVADQQMDYEDLSPVILAGSQAGFTKFKFAVVRKD